MTVLTISHERAAKAETFPRRAKAPGQEEKIMQYRIWIDGKPMQYECCEDENGLEYSDIMERVDVFSMDLTEHEESLMLDAMDKIEAGEADRIEVENLIIEKS